MWTNFSLVPSGGAYLVLNHVADLGQEILADDTVEVAVLWGGLVLDALRQTGPLFLCFTHKGPGASLVAWQENQTEAKVKGQTQKSPDLVFYKITVLPVLG